MERQLKKVKDRRKLIQNNYLSLARDIWNSNLETEKKESNVRTEHRKYRSEDKHLERLEQMIQSAIEDLMWYEETFLK